jgi:hypothetical protein
MKKLFLILFIVISVFSAANLSAQEKITAEEILLKADEARAPRESFLLKTNFVQYKNGKDDQKASIDVYVNAKNKYNSLARFLLPQYNKDRILLNSKDAVWIFIPGTKRVIRLSASQRLFGEPDNAFCTRNKYPYGVF